MVADARKRSGANEAIAAAIARFGRLDILVNNAQSSTPGVPLESIDDDTIALTLESGLLGTLYYMQAAFPHLKERGGCIINLGRAKASMAASDSASMQRPRKAFAACRHRGARMGQAQHPRQCDLSGGAEPSRDQYLESTRSREGVPCRDRARPLRRSATGHRADRRVSRFFGLEYLTGQTLNADGGQMML